MTVLATACGGPEAGGATGEAPAGPTVAQRLAMAERTTLPAPLQADLERLATEGIPVDIVFEQGVDVMAAAR